MILNIAWPSVELTGYPRSPKISIGQPREFFGEKWVEPVEAALVLNIGWFTVEGLMR
jgi:hypothetical protein